MKEEEFNKLLLFLDEKTQSSIMKFYVQIRDVINKLNDLPLPIDKKQSEVAYKQCDELCDRLLKDLQKKYRLK